MLNGAIAGMAVGALLLTAGVFAIPQDAAAQAFGGYADTLVFSVVPQDQAVASVSSGEIDMYGFRLDAATDKQAARDDPNINAMEALGGSRSMIVNPCAPSDGRFNPFTIREIREAQQWAYDRNFLAEIAGGFPMTSPYVRGEPEYERDAPFFEALEAQYSYDPARAKAQVDDAMSQVPNASFDAASNQWLMNGTEIEVIIVQRVEDIRFEIGAYVATEVTKLGFTPILDPSTFSEALDKVYFNDAKLGIWNMYTEGWGSGGFVQFEDTQTNFFYNGDFGSVIWDCYEPPASLTIPCQALNDGLYADEDERRDLLRKCVTEGMREGVRIFLLADLDVYAFNRGVSNTVFSLLNGPLQPFAVRTTIKNGMAGGTLNIAQPIHTGSAWNSYGGFQDVYSRYQAYSITDFGTYRHPHLNVVIPVRAEFTVNRAGPSEAFSVPTSALTFDIATNNFVNVPAGVTSRAHVDFDLLFGEWHHGEMISMDDVVAHIAMLSRLASGDLASRNPYTHAQVYLVRWDSSFRGFEILDEDSIRIWYDTFHVEDSVIAERADVFPWYPWELNAIMTESVLANETAFDDTSADVLGIEPLDLAKGATFYFFDPRLAANRAAKAIPLFLSVWVTSAEAEARWAALDRWRNPPDGCSDGPNWTCNYFVSQGPYVLDQYFTEPEGALYTAKRNGYPLEQDAWDFLGTVRVPNVAFGPLPEVVQTFPATFRFTTTINEEPYDRIATPVWELVDPATDRTLFEGSAMRIGPGTWDIKLTPVQTAALFEGTYELKTVVIGDETPLPMPVVNSLSFTSVSLASFIFSELTVYTVGTFTQIRDPIGEITAATEAAFRATNAARNMMNIALTMAIVALVAAMGVIAAQVVWSRRPPPW